MASRLLYSCLCGYRTFKSADSVHVTAQTYGDHGDGVGGFVDAVDDSVGTQVRGAHPLVWALQLTAHAVWVGGEAFGDEGVSGPCDGSGR